MAAAADATVTLNAFETGLYSPGLLATPDYTTGISFAFGSETRGYLVFDLASLQSLGGHIVAASLLIENPASINEVGPGDPLPLRVYGLPEANAGNFGSHAGSGSGGNFAYIGSNPSNLFASRSVTPADSGTLLRLDIDAAGVSHLDTSRDNGFYAYGMKIVKADAQEPKPLQYVFNGTAGTGHQVQLVLDLVGVVPEVGTAWLWALGLPALVWARRGARVDTR